MAVHDRHHMQDAFHLRGETTNLRLPLGEALGMAFGESAFQAFAVGGVLDGLDLLQGRQLQRRLRQLLARKRLTFRISAVTKLKSLK